ncbi:hypothetical protein BDY19DRAFT_197703 [Irpex rosettiformis]|uniref:Uncharacterized protein n=1 Tax=Irpex rosettiformis TaxID=378272 RepID=A0ACB8U2G8_9APHY|nr:hypothetical protein BDY19DRAFT_197703 [Irpex rosettiformis]
MSGTSTAQLTPVGDYIYTGTSASALYMFDMCITLSREIEAIWSRKIFRAAWIYIFIRYGTLMLHILSFTTSINPKRYACAFVRKIERRELKNDSCHAIARNLQALDLMQHFSYALFAALRVYAFVPGSRIRFLVIGTVLALNLLPVATSILTIVTSDAVWEEDIQACFLTSTISQSTSLNRM